MLNGQNICQVAFSALDAGRLRSWYQDVFGLVNSSATIFGGPPTSRVQGMPNVWERCLWLIDSQDYFQLEFFQFWSPKSKPRPNHWQATDIGYSAVGIVVRDFDAVLERARQLGSPALGAILGEAGNRRAALKDPEGNVVELYEEDPLPSAASFTVRPEVPATVRCMTVSVPDLERSRQAWVDGLGLTPIDDAGLHSDDDMRMWGLEDVSAKRLLLSSGNFLVELVQYQQPLAADWPAGYRICDQGFMNVAMGLPDTARFDTRFDWVGRQGLRPNGKPLEIGVFKVMYVNDVDGFSVELLNARRKLWSLSGFNPGIPYVENEIWIDADADKVWQAITNHSGIGQWCLFKGSLLKPGEQDSNGLGAIRQLKGLGLTITEEVTEWQAPLRYSYRLTAGAPVKDHRGDVMLFPERGGTRVRWAIQFRSKIPLGGGITALLLKLIFGNALKRLKAKLENVPA